MGISTPPRKRRVVWTPALGRVLMLSRPLPLLFPLLMLFMVALLLLLVLSLFSVLQVVVDVIVRMIRKRINAPLLRFAPQNRPLNPRTQLSRKGQIDLLNQLNQSNEILVTTLLKKRIGIKRKIRRRIVASLLRSASLHSASSPSLP